MPHASRAAFPILLALASGAAGTGAPDASPEEIEALVRDLSDPDIERRDGAQARLLAIGEAAEPAVFRAFSGDDLEARCRAGQILKTMGFVPPDIRKRVAVLVEAMKRARTIREGAEAWSELAELGWMATDTLQEAFPDASLPDGSCAMTVTTREVPAAPLDGLLSVRIENRTKHPAWISASDFMLQVGKAHLPLEPIEGGRTNGYALLYLAPEGAVELAFRYGPVPAFRSPGSDVEIQVLYRPGRRAAKQIDMDAYMDDLRGQRDPAGGDRPPKPPPPTLIPGLSCTARVLVKP